MFQWRGGERQVVPAHEKSEATCTTAEDLQLSREVENNGLAFYGVRLLRL